jgi:hypothetical protein
MHVLSVNSTIFPIVVENSVLTAVHDDSTPRAYKDLIARGYLGYLVRSFVCVLAAVLFCPFWAI